MTPHEALRALDNAASDAARIFSRERSSLAPALRIMSRDVGLMFEGRYTTVTARPVVLEDFSVRAAE